QYGPTGGGWTFAGSSGIQANGSAWGAANAPDGTQTAFLQGNGDLGAISQAVYLPAGTYRVSFQAAQRSYGDGVQPIKFSVNGVQVGSLISPTSTSFALYTTASFTVKVAGCYTLQFAATDNSGDKSSFLDAISIADPEPGPDTVVILPT